MNRVAGFMDGLLFGRSSRGLGYMIRFKAWEPLTAKNLPLPRRRPSCEWPAPVPRKRLKFQHRGLARRSGRVAAEGPRGVTVTLSVTQRHVKFARPMIACRLMTRAPGDRRGARR